MVEQEEGDTDDEGWKRHVEHEHADEDRPSEQWHLHEADTGCTHGEYGRDEVHSTKRG